MLSQTDRKFIALAMGSGIARESLGDRKLSQLQLQLQLQQLTTSMAGFSSCRPVSDARRASAASTSPNPAGTSNEMDDALRALDRLDFTPDPTCVALWCRPSPNPADFYVRATEHAGHCVPGLAGKVFPHCRPCRAIYSRGHRQCACGHTVHGQNFFHVTEVLR